MCIRDRVSTQSTWGKTAMVVGYGGIGREIAKKLKLAFNMRILALDKFTNLTEGKEYVERIYPMEDLVRLAPEADFVITAVPLTVDTMNIYNEEFFKSMKKNGVFVSLGRGESVDEEALLKALRGGWIQGAALDVTRNEPIKADSVWFDPELRGKLLLTFHTMHMSKGTADRMADTFLENYSKFLNGQRLSSIVEFDHNIPEGLPEEGREFLRQITNLTSFKTFMNHNYAIILYSHIIFNTEILQMHRSIFTSID
eukprot:TRINITY_DN1997_c0_g1_i4.p1 TRINITY_DN1997_c0_g1~~TRINITY_DN1997_c0_g1_i4.p1  ORF type:complete len:270 (-),score=62.00 TRINITY_DN1997_c0_g1_i4:27-791(-)